MTAFDRVLDEEEVSDEEETEFESEQNGGQLMEDELEDESDEESREFVADFEESDDDEDLEVSAKVYFVDLEPHALLLETLFGFLANYTVNTCSVYRSVYLHP